ncbi:hypothetical protein M0R19_06205 [Candidatus Pacearchaeota archaeon]|jgi:hypothetical protein|nr:hypothetical protein [Candidatus Pacearchaeota archaeon]
MRKIKITWIKILFSISLIFLDTSIWFNNIAHTFCDKLDIHKKDLWDDE